MVTLDQVKQILDYDPETGIFRWKYSPSPFVKANDIAGCIKNGPNGGHRSIKINKKSYFAHRLAWLVVTGEWPEFDIDHINGKRDDNRYSNLRLATKAQNNHNRSINKNNKIGYKGVHLHKQSGKWKAQIAHNGKKKHIGLYATPEEAHKAYCEYADKLHGEFSNHGKDSRHSFL
jgi:hypothetical protein